MTTFGQQAVVVMAIAAVFFGCANGQRANTRTQASAKSSEKATPGKDSLLSSSAAAVGSPGAGDIELPNSSTRRTFQPGPPWGEVWCIRLDAVWSDELAQRLLPDATALRTFGNPTSCDAAISADLLGGRLNVGVQCGERVSTFRKPAREKAIYDPELDAKVHIYPQSVMDPADVLMAWDANVPCYLSIRSTGIPPEQSGQRIRAIAKEILQRLTPERIAAPRAELVITAIDETGDKARAELARWPSKRAAVDAIMTLAPGYPKLARSDDFPELPPGQQFLLLGICPNQQGQNMAQVMQGIFPPPPANVLNSYLVEHRTVDGLGLPVDCPEEVVATSLSPGTGAWIWPMPEDRVVTISAVMDATTDTGPTYARIAAFSFDADRNVLDFKTADVPRLVDTQEPGRYLPLTTKRYGKCMTGSGGLRYPIYAYGCDVRWGDYLCLGKPEHESIEHVFELTDDHKLEMRVNKSKYAGTGCQTAE